MENIESLLLQVNEIIKKYDEFNKKTGRNFNIFSIIDKSELELAHEKFIGELLNPKGSHNQGDKFLKLFLDILDIKQKLKNPKVILEKVIDENRRIDIVIEDKNFIVAIEMKVNAKDQENQLYDYYQYIKNTNPKFFRLYYLTPDGRDAGENSTKNLKEGKDYYLISFQNEIYEWIKSCMKESCEIPILREAINQYKLLLEKIFNLAKDKNEEVMEKIEKNIKAAYEIYNNYIEVWKNKIYEFYGDIWDNVYDEYGEKHNWRDPNIYEFDFNEIWYKDEDCNEIREKEEILKEMNISKFGIAFAKDLNKNSSMCVSLENWYENPLSFYIWIVKNEEPICPEKCKDILKLPEYSTFPALYKSINITFFYKKNNPSFELFEEKQYKNIVKTFSNEMIDILKLIDSNLEKIKKLV